MSIYRPVTEPVVSSAKPTGVSSDDIPKPRVEGKPKKPKKKVFVVRIPEGWLVSIAWSEMISTGVGAGINIHSTTTTLKDPDHLMTEEDFLK